LQLSKLFKNNSPKGSLSLKITVSLRHLLLKVQDAAPEGTSTVCLLKVLSAGAPSLFKNFPVYFSPSLLFFISIIIPQQTLLYNYFEIKRVIIYFSINIYYVLFTYKKYY
jgi:hypothetical protein